MSTGRPPGRPRTVSAAAGEPPAVEVLDDPAAEPEPEEIAAEALEGRARLTPEVVRALNETWRDVVQYEDDASRALARRIVGRLRRATHLELHPGCARVTINVSALPNKAFVRINERVYFGRVEVWECEARTIRSLEWHANVVEAQRMDEKQSEHPTMDLDSPFAERARAIQRA